MKAELATELINILYELDWEREGNKDQFKNRFEELITNLFNRIDIREDVLEAINKIPDYWPQPVVKLFAIIVDNIAPEDVNLAVFTTPEGVAIRFNEDYVLRLEKTMNKS